MTWVILIEFQENPRNTACMCACGRISRDVLSQHCANMWEINIKIYQDAHITKLDERTYDDKRWINRVIYLDPEFHLRVAGFHGHNRVLHTGRGLLQYKNQFHQVKCQLARRRSVCKHIAVAQMKWFPNSDPCAFGLKTHPARNSRRQLPTRCEVDASTPVDLKILTRCEVHSVRLRSFSYKKIWMVLIVLQNLFSAGLLLPRPAKERSCFVQRECASKFTPTLGIFGNTSLSRAFLLPAAKSFCQIPQMNKYGCVNLLWIETGVEAWKAVNADCRDMLIFCLVFCAVSARSHDKDLEKVWYGLDWKLGSLKPWSESWVLMGFKASRRGIRNVTWQHALVERCGFGVQNYPNEWRSLSELCPAFLVYHLG